MTEELKPCACGLEPRVPLGGMEGRDGAFHFWDECWLEDRLEDDPHRDDGSA